MNAKFVEGNAAGVALVESMGLKLHDTQVEIRADEQGEMQGAKRLPGHMPLWCIWQDGGMEWQGKHVKARFSCSEEWPSGPGMAQEQENHPRASS